MKYEWNDISNEPEDSDTYLVLWNPKNRPTCLFYGLSTYDSETGEWDGVYNFKDFEKVYPEVELNYWMPLPPMYDDEF